MIFWVVVTGLVLVVAAFLGHALLSPNETGESPAEYDLRVYRDQMAEVDRDVARGVLDPAEAERARAEIGRRILAADTARQAETPLPGGGRVRLGLAIGAPALLLLGGSLGLYLWLGQPGYGDLALADRLAQAEAARQSRPGQDAAQREFLADLAADAQANAGDAARLATIENVQTSLSNIIEQHEALGAALAAAGEDAAATDYVGYAELLILAARNYVSPEAEAALRNALERDPGNGVARYYWGLMYAQTGRPDQAFRIWDALLRRGPPDAPWIPRIQERIDDAAYLAGINYTQPPPGTGRGPSAADLDAAGDMTAEERMEMVEGMVSTLSRRLSTEGGPVEEWAQLIQALGVLGRRADADAVYRDALEVFNGDDGARDILDRAGSRAGVAE